MGTRLLSLFVYVCSCMYVCTYVCVNIHRENKQGQINSSSKYYSWFFPQKVMNFFFFFVEVVTFVSPSCGFKRKICSESSNVPNKETSYAHLNLG